jgi:HlyD family secretion protein
MIVLGIVVLGGLGWTVLSVIRPTVTVTDVARGPIVQAFYSTGTVLPVREYDVKSNLEGTLKNVHVDKGDGVTRGQVLAEVAAPEMEYAYRKAKAELDEKVKRADPSTSPVLLEYDAKISATGDLLAIAKRELDRVTKLTASSAASQTDVDRATDRVKQFWSEFESLKARRAASVLEQAREVDVAKAAVDTAQWNLDQRKLVSPVDGVVLDRPVSVGIRLAVNDHVMQVADVRVTNLVMRAQVDEEDKTMVRVGQVVRMTLYSFPGKVFEGKVKRVYDKADPDRRTFEVDVTFDAPSDQLSAGMTGELAFVIAEKAEATVIPAQAVQAGAVWLVRDGKLHKSDAKVGITSIERAELLTDKSLEGHVVISPVGDHAEGQRVRTTFTDPITAAGLNKPKEREGEFRGLQ